MNALIGLARWLRPWMLGAVMALLLGACASQPPVPDWRVNAQAASERATSAYLAGNTRVANLEFDRMRKEVARTGDAGLMARAELLRCSTQVASLVFEPCSGFEALRADAAAPEIAYHAESAGDAVEARRVRRRIELVLNGGALPPAAPSKPAAP
jgi:hypothetical protein